MNVGSHRLVPAENTSRNPWLAALFTAAALALVLWAANALPGPGNTWVVPEGLHQAEGYPAGTPGLRPVNLMEWCLLSGSPLFIITYWGLVVFSVLSLRQRKKARFASAAVAVAALTALRLLQGPVLVKMSQSIRTECVLNLKNLGTAMEFYKADHGHYPSDASELFPEYLKEAPICPLTGRPYEIETTPISYAIKCHPHPPYYFGDDCTILGKNYLSRKPGGELLRYSSEEGFTSEPEH